MQCATAGPRGLPHMVPLWFVPDGVELRGWTYAKSQKTRNLERDPRATVGIEEGVEYQDLRGVMLECDVEIGAKPSAWRSSGSRSSIATPAARRRVARDASEAGARSAWA